jgi:hypothetical protein
MRKLSVLIFLLTAGTLYGQDWPRVIESQVGTITIYQPQIETYNGIDLTARTAISIVPNGSDAPVFGAAWLDCRVSTDRTNRIVRLEDVKVKRIKFPNGQDEQTSKISATLEDQMPRLELTFSLDLLLESLETAQKQKESARELEVTPPRIIVVNHPAVLVLIDGDPVLEAVEGTSLKRVTNTPYFIVQVGSGRFYLRGGATWYSAALVAGPWTKTDVPPKAAVDLSEQSSANNESDDELNADTLRLKTGQIPEIIVSTEPAELIASDGPIQLSPIEGTGLLYATNSPNRVFLEIATQQYYILLSGRWYRSKTMNGPWTNVESKKLPKDFAQIPPGSPCDDVLSSVAGTIPAKEAIQDAQIPQTAEVDRATATADVQYDGNPQFDPIENTGMDYAVNTPTPVVRVDGRYYACQNGVWFDGPDALGPWGVCISVPSVIYTIPPRYPVYNVRYVRVYGYNSSVAYVGYTAGYTGSYVFGGTVVYGTGYRYRMWYRHSYVARPSTWGFGMHYDPWSGWAFGASVGWGQPRGWFAHDARTVYPGWWGPVGYRPVYQPVVRPAYRAGYHPAYRQAAPTPPPPSGNNRSGGATRSSAIYGRWSAGVKRPTIGQTRPNVGETRPPAQSMPPPRPDVPPEKQPAVRPADREPRTEERGNLQVTPPPISRPIVRTSPPVKRENNVYAAPDGNVMRKTPQGWQQRDRNTWKDAGQAPARQGVVRDQEVRQRAAERSSGFLTIPTATPVVKAPPPQKTQPPPTRNSGDERKKDEKKR